MFKIVINGKTEKKFICLSSAIKEANNISKANKGRNVKISLQMEGINRGSYKEIRTINS